MSRTGRVLALVVGVFLALGLGLGVAGHLAVGWAGRQFVVGASGASPAEFGPVFVALVAFQTTVAALLVGVAVAGLVGAMAGSRFVAVRRAGLVAGVGSLLGFYVMGGTTVLLVSLAGGPGTEQVFDPGAALGPLALTGLLAGLAGGVGGVAGATLVR
jgi:hypothetical protein